MVIKNLNNSILNEKDNILEFEERLYQELEERTELACYINHCTCDVVIYA